ncbi:hypothetical protein KR009_003218, partial [Drosophila setifemur]
KPKMTDVNINVQCECYHRRGLLYLANPWAWGRPCRRCRRMMSRNIVVVQPQGTTVNAVPAQVLMPNQGTTTTTTMVVPAQSANNWQTQQQMYQQQPMVSTLPPKYDQAVIAN